jgi:hypothetical protein
VQHNDIHPNTNSLLHQEDEKHSNAEILASYLSQTEDENGRKVTTVEFFDR